MKSVACLIQRTIRALWAPRHKLSMAPAIWKRLVAELERRGDGVRESGAFLLGAIHHGRREALDFVPYDELEPGCLDRGYINFTSTGYQKLWGILKEKKMQVVADIHTHPGGAGQSEIDQANPMMPSVGHLALILPHYAKGEPEPADAGLYIFLGNHRWKAFPPGKSKAEFYVGYWS